MAQVLSDRPCLRIHLEVVLNHLSQDSRHVRRLPCEHISVILQKLDEHAFLLVSEAIADDRSLALVREPKVLSSLFLQSAS
jgi:hypothetical protein